MLGTLLNFHLPTRNQPVADCIIYNYLSEDCCLCIRSCWLNKIYVVDSLDREDWNCQKKNFGPSSGILLYAQQCDFGICQQTRLGQPRIFAPLFSRIHLLGNHGKALQQHQHPSNTEQQQKKDFCMYLPQSCFACTLPFCVLHHLQQSSVTAQSKGCHHHLSSAPEQLSNASMSKPLSSQTSQPTMPATTGVSCSAAWGTC